MKTFGILETQTLVSLYLNDDGTINLELIRPRDKWEQDNSAAPWNQENPSLDTDWSSSIWEPPTIVPLVKLPQPQLDPVTEYCEPKLVWFEDRVERDWEIKTILPEQIAEKAAKLVVSFRSLAFSLEASGLYSAVKAAALSTTEGEIWWETAKSSTVARDHPFVAQLQSVLGKTDAEIDAIFDAAH